MSMENTYEVKGFLSVFHPIPLGQKIGDCKMDFDQKRKKYFISVIVSAETQREAEQKGFIRFNQVLPVFCIHTGVSHKIGTITVSQISGSKPHLHSSKIVLVRETHLPLTNEKIGEIENTLRILDKLPNEKRTTKIITRAINYFLRGCYLETQWRSESFLNFYKVTELIAQDFRKDFSEELRNQLKGTLLEKLTEIEREKLRTPKRLVQFMCLQLNIPIGDEISRIVALRPKFSAHATLKEVDVSSEEFNECKAISGKVLINYIHQQVHG